MEAHVIATLKDNILKSLSNSVFKHGTLDEIYKKLDIGKVPIKVVQGYVADMEKNGAVSCSYMPNEKLLLALRPTGEQLLKKGGHVKHIETELTDNNLLDNDIQRIREETNIEIKNLKADILTHGEVVKGLEKQTLKELQDNMRRIANKEVPGFDQYLADKAFKEIMSEPPPPKNNPPKK